MSISREDVEHIAKLAKLDLTEAEKDSMEDQLGAILEYMEKLDELDTDDVEPLSHVMELTNVFREDTAGESLERETALANAPESKDGFFIVPKVIET